MSGIDVSLAPAIRAYVMAANTGDSSVAAIFAAEAQVFDEREHRVGPQEIARWMDASHRVRPRLQILGVQQRTGKVLLDSLVCGDFSDSPQTLRYTFRLDPQGRIARLDISR
ncbi:nuclear transport factor 2 family protein [Pseudomonas protegens]|uniref:nuclear transport factor 2 family protein n=1 Tax=Pseudomonas protegens TaxID=380021 RepID=UPI00275800D7|nr:nuclear transport factor 2 family protein [Pseudomonas protegens]MDP9509734.1 nuclear transport factor 2 family protein [Pseudomonas protegens]